MESYEAKFARRKRFQRVVSMLCCICVFITTYALILPAITMEAEADCGIKEHTHGDECYAWVEQSSIVCDEGHTHTSTCYDEAGTLICGKEEVIVVHTHDALCHDASGALICGLSEVTEHTHTDECYESIPSEPKCICEKEEDEHEHSDACRLICKLSDEEKHVHTDACLGDVLVCELMETDGHTHGEECYGEAVLTCDASKHEHTDECHAGELICEMNGVEGHEHTPACRALSCEESKHEHTDACYTKPLICTLDQSEAHTHGEDCFERKNVCGVEEGEVHTHSEACYGEEYVCGHDCHKHTDECYEASEPTRGELTCTKQEVVLHTHSDECYADVDGVRTLVCTQPIVIAHQHTADCIHTDRVRGDLTCEIEAHTHTSTCWASYYTLPAGSDEDDVDYFDDDYDPDLEGYGEGVGAGNFTTLTSGEPVTQTDDAYRNLTEHTANKKVNVSVETATFDGTQYLSGLTLSYTLEDGTLYNKNTSTYYLNYELPLAEKMSVAKLDEWEDAYDDNYSATLQGDGSAKKPAFKFCFVKRDVDGKEKYFVQIQYEKDYAKYVANLSSPTTGKLEFSAQIDKGALQPDGSIIVPWDQAVNGQFEIKKNDIKYEDNETANTDIHSSKSGSYDATNKTLTYTVTVWSDKGTGASIDFYDEMNLTHDGSTLGLGTPTIVVKKYKGSDYQNDVTVSDSQFGGTTEKKTLTMTLPALGAGEKYEVTYTYPVTVTNGTAFWQNNKVKVSADPNEGYIEHESETSVSINKKLLKKSGSYDQTNGTINWTITVNENADNIAGYTLTDTWFSGLKEADITISPSNGYTIKKDDSGNITGIVFSGENDENCLKYTITYSTSHDQTNKDESVLNHVHIENKDGDEDDENASVSIPAVGVEKSGAFSPDGSKIIWTINFDVPKDGIAADTEIYDQFFKHYVDNSAYHYMTKEQKASLVTALNSAFGEGKYDLYFCDANKKSWEEGTWVPSSKYDEDTPAYGWKVVLKDKVTSSSKTITLSYETTPDYEKSSTFYNYVKYGGKDDNAEITKKSRISKMNGSGSTSTSVNYSTDGTIEWRIEVKAEKGDTTLTVADFLPKGLEVVNVGVATWSYYDSNATVPGRTWIWLDGKKLVTDITKEQATDSDHNTDGTKLTFKIALRETETSEDALEFPKDYTIYIALKCKVTPEFIKANIQEKGASQEFEFTNYATFEGETASQTQKWTLKREVAVLKYDAKNDYNGSGVDTNVKYDTKTDKGKTLAWYVRVYLEDGYNQNTDGFLTIYETLPEGLSVKSVGVGYTADSAKSETNRLLNFGTTFTAPGNAEIKAKFYYERNATGVERLYACSLIGNNFPAGTYIYLYIECTINDDAPFTENSDGTSTATFENQASVKINNKPFGSDSQTQTVTKTGNNGEKLIKTSSQLQQNVIDYTVVINGDKDDLNKNSETLSFRDTMTYNNGNNGDLVATLKPTSVILWYAEKQDDGTYKKLSQVPAADWSWTYTYNTPTDKNSDHTHTITGTIPDSTALILEYTYDLSFGDNTQVNFNVTNNFKLSGENEIKDSSNDWVKWDSSIPLGSASSLGSLPFYKVKKGDFTYRLKNAEFSVYRVETTGNDTFMVALKSDEDGFFSIKHDYVKQGYYTTNTLYYITETKAPDGYVLPANPQKYYFYFPDAENTTQTTEQLNMLIGKVKAADASASIFNLQYTQSPIYIENEPIDTKLDIEKTWLASNGDKITGVSKLPDSISVTLYREAEGSAKTEVGTYEIKKEDEWKLTINDLPLYNVYGKQYTYSVVENGLTGWILQQEYDVVERKEGETATGKYDGKLTMTNTEIDYVDINVVKTWDSALTPHKIQVLLYQYKTTDPDDVPKVQMDEDGNLKLPSGTGFSNTGKTLIIDMDADSEWKGTFTHLPLRGVGSDGETYYYFYFAYEIVKSYVKSYSVTDQTGDLSFIAGGTINIHNKPQTVEIVAEKNWGNDVDDLDKCGVEFQLKQVKTPADATADSPEQIETSNYGESVKVNKNNDWKHTWSNLPAYEYDSDGLIIAEYTYYVEEVSVSSLFKPSYRNEQMEIMSETPANAATTSGTITVLNEYAYNYTLPVTGGSGTQMFTITGAVLMVGCAMLLAFNKKRRRGA